MKRPAEAQVRYEAIAAHESRILSDCCLRRSSVQRRFTALVLQ